MRRVTEHLKASYSDSQGEKGRTNRQNININKLRKYFITRHNDENGRTFEHAVKLN